MDEIALKFKELQIKWKNDIKFLSSPIQIIDNYYYQEIIKLGYKAIPLILKSMEKDNALWFSALRELTNENPVTDDMVGYTDRMSEAWLTWGRNNGHI